jgi:hypothetical protein
MGMESENMGWNYTYFLLKEIFLPLSALVSPSVKQREESPSLTGLW